MKHFNTHIPWFAMLLLSVAAWFTSCSTPQNVAYFQDAMRVNGMETPDEELIRFRPTDKLNVVVNSSDPMLEAQFTLTAQSKRNTLGAPTDYANLSSSNSGTAQPLSYTVDEQGDITFPVLGKIAAAGKTRLELAENIRHRLISRDLVKDPTVTVEYVDMSVSVLGEVNKPGRAYITKDRYTILDAITAAGDLTINGEREKVMVSREENGETHSYYINLCSKKSLYSSPVFYLQQDDVVYVMPNDKRKREAKVNGNTIFTPSFWISVASLLSTITALIVK